MVGCLGVVLCRLEQYKELGIPDVLGRMHTSAVVGTTQILQETFGLKDQGLGSSQVVFIPEV